VKKQKRIAANEAKGKFEPFEHMENGRARYRILLQMIFKRLIFSWRFLQGEFNVV